MANTTVELQIPNLGESITEATLVAWVKPDGATVDANDVVAELETDKATVELPAGASGVLRILTPKGQTVKVGDVVARLEAGGEKPEARSQKPEAPPTPTQDSGLKTQDSLPPSPAVRRAAEETGVDLRQVAGTGKGGRVTKADVLTPMPRGNGGGGPAQGQDAAAAAASHTARAGQEQAAGVAPGTTAVYTPPAVTPQAAPEERVEMSKLRQTIARRLVDAQHVTASLTTFNEIDMSTVMGLREKYKEPFEKKYGVSLGYMSFFAKAVCAAIREVPAVNAMIDGTALVYRKYVHLGIAVSTPRGLMVPVVRHAEGLSMAQIEGEIKRLATRAREGKITVDEMAGGTFTITNGGVFGSLLSTPILNPPQAGILGMHKIEKRAVVIDDGIAIRPMMYVALTYDHRVIDGQQSVTFLVKVKEMLEDPARIVIEV